MKRFLSVILVIAIMASVMPMSFATLTWGGNSISEDMYFEFSSPGHGFTGSSDTNDVDGDGDVKETHPWRSLSNAHNKDMKSTDLSVSDPWRFVGNYDSVSLSLNDVGFAWSFYLDESYDLNSDGTVDVQPFDPDADHHIRATMFEIQCNESGMFKPTLTTRGSKAGAVFDIYIVPKTDADSDRSGANLSTYVKGLDREYCVGTVDTYDKDDSLFFGHELKPVDITAGNYYLILVPTGVNENTVYSKKTLSSGAGVEYPYSSFKSLSFAPMAGANTTSCEYIINTDVIKKGGAYGTEGADANGMPWTTNKTTASAQNVLYKSGGSYSISNTSVDIMKYIDTEKTAPWNLALVSGRNSYNVTSIRFHMNALNGDNTGGLVATTDRFREGEWAFAGFEIKVPAAGKYSLGIKPLREEDGAVCKFFVLPVTRTLTRALYNKEEYCVGELSFYKAGGNGEVADENYTAVGTFDAASAGKYYVVCELHKGEGTPYKSSTWADLDGDKTTGNSGKAYEEGATIDGKEYNYLRYLYEAKIAGIQINSVGMTDEDREIADEREQAKNVDADNAVKEAAVSRDSEVRIFSSVGEVIGTESYTAGGASVTLDAADYTPDGYEFLYWAKGIGLNKHAVCDTEEYTFTPEKGLMNLTAVFREADSEYITVEFYNMNRALVKRYDMTYKAGDEIKMEDLPYMTGLGRAKGWILATDNSSYGAEDSATASGKAMIFVADYDEPESDLVITVNDGTLASGATSSSFAYGDEVTVNAKIRTKDGKKFFAYWKRGDEIVSFEREYTFNAYKSETITAVYSEYETAAQKMRKIVVDSIATGSGSSLIAEFLVDNETVIERGFVFGNGTPTVNDCTYKSTMITDKKQFSIFDDSNLNSRAYAILADGVIYSE